MFTVKVKHVFGPSRKLLKLFKELLEACQSNNHHHHHLPTIKGGDISFGFDSLGITLLGETVMATYTIPDDQADFTISISPISGAKDAEGRDVEVKQALKSSDENVISLTFPNGNGDLTNVLAHVGAPGVASVDYVASVKVGRKLIPVKQADATFIVTTGNIDASTISGGDLTIADLEPDPVEPPAA